VRIGIVADVHGNADGLALALERMGDVDEVLCAGDMIEEYRFTNEVLELLADRGARCVNGNHDMGLLSAHGRRAREAKHVRPELVSYLAEQPLEVDVTVDGKRLIMTHASPCEPHSQYVLRHSPELKRLAEIDADYIILGHTHAQMVERVGRSLVINPGSAGQARDHRNGRQLSYAVLDTTTDEVVIEDYTVGAPATRGAPQP
jgi:putative phosphoesterase